MAMMLRWLALASLIAGLQGPAEGRKAAAAQLPAAGPAAPAVTAKTYLPIVGNRYAPGYESPFGIVMYTTVNNAAGQAKLRAAGAHWYTTGLVWAEVEPLPPVGSVHTYTWGSLDQDAANVAAYGGEMYVLVNRNPRWASAYPSGPLTNTAHLVAFAAAAAERYDGDGVSDAPGHPVIRYWSFYAEPDNGAVWAALLGKGYWGHNPTGYADMLKLVSPAIHAANPNAKVLIGGIAYDSFEGPPDNGPFVQSFLGNVLSALGNSAATQYIDAIAFHYYPINLNRWPSIREKGLEIRGIMNAHGVGHLELLVPEMGYWSDPANGSNELRQAEVLAQMYVKGLTIGLSHMDWFAVFDDGPGMEAHGLFRNGDLNTPKLAYTAYGVLTAALRAKVYNRTFGISGGEGYVFRGADGSEVTVAWATGTSATAYLPGNCARRTDLLGSVSVLGGSGQVAVPLAQNHPVYLEQC
ncbi:MAG: hypothetical protein IT317_18565 [Anaerolineales bacterium]|nr:hypothetical protein [Anaerolineales bacterium]